MAAHCSGCVFKVCVCSLLCVCVHFGWDKCRARILSMGHHTWPYVTSLSLIVTIIWIIMTAIILVLINIIFIIKYSNEIKYNIVLYNLLSHCLQHVLLLLILYLLSYINIVLVCIWYYYYYWQSQKHFLKPCSVVIFEKARLEEDSPSEELHYKRLLILTNGTHCQVS